MSQFWIHRDYDKEMLKFVCTDWILSCARHFRFNSRNAPFSKTIYSEFQTLYRNTRSLHVTAQYEQENVVNIHYKGSKQ